MENHKTELVYSEYIFIHVGDVISDFMDQFKTICRYDSFDHIFMKRVLQNISPAFIHRTSYENNLNYVMGNFSDTALIYSDDTYDPSRTIKAAYKLANHIFSTLQINGAYVDDMFPYMFHDLTPALAAVFKFYPFYSKQHINFLNHKEIVRHAS